MLKVQSPLKYNMQPICTHTISLQSSKPSHAYPIIRLPREFSSLAGAKGTILQTIYKGALAFLVVINDPPLKRLGRSRNVKIKANRSLDMAEVAGPTPAEPIRFSALWLLWHSSLQHAPAMVGDSTIHLT